MSNSKLEHTFDRGYKKYLEQHHYYYLLKIPDIPFSKKNKQPVDRFLFNEYKNIAIELKYTSTDRMECRRIKDHQLEDLKLFKRIAGDSYLLFSLNGFEKVCLVEIDDYLQFKKQLGQESFTYDHLDLMKYQEINVEKLRKHYRLDLRIFIPHQMIISSFM